MKTGIIGTYCGLALLLALAPACGSGCDAETACRNKNDKLITSGKIIPICGAATQRDGTRYSWRTDSGTCSCTLSTSTSTGQTFWRQCQFAAATASSLAASPLGEDPTPATRR